MFSSFTGVCFAVKSKLTVKHLLLTRKMLRKIRKTVYGKHLLLTRKMLSKPFSKTHALSLLSSHCLCSLSHCRNSAQPPPATPTCASLSLLSFSLSARILSCPTPARASSSHPQPPRRTVASCTLHRSAPLCSCSPNLYKNQNCCLRLVSLMVWKVQKVGKGDWGLRSQLR
jgi:hypothetical protein